jgi:hypothetical protein
MSADGSQLKSASLLDVVEALVTRTRGLHAPPLAILNPIRVLLSPGVASPSISKTRRPCSLMNFTTSFTGTARATSPTRLALWDNQVNNFFASSREQRVAITPPGRALRAPPTLAPFAGRRSNQVYSNIAPNQVQPSSQMSLISFRVGCSSDFTKLPTGWRWGKKIHSNAASNWHWAHSLTCAMPR